MECRSGLWLCTAKTPPPHLPAHPFFPILQIKKRRESGGGGLFLREAAVLRNDSCRLVHNLADLLLVQHPAAQYPNPPGPPESPDVIPLLFNEKSNELSFSAKANAGLR